MSKKAAPNAYKKLGGTMIILFILIALCCAGYYIMDQSVKVQETENAQRANEENQLLQAQYEQAKAEEQQKEDQGESMQWPAPAATGWDVVDLSAFPINNSYEAGVSRKDLLLGGMILVNQWHSLPDDFYTVAEGEMSAIYQVDKNIGVSGSSVRTYPTVIAAYSAMMDAAKQDGLEHFCIDEAYRAYATQEESYKKIEEKYSSRYQGDALRKKASQEVSYPGTGEYQTGFSLRLFRYERGNTAFNEVEFYESEHSDWLVANSWKYGFVFRYPVAGYPNETVTDKSYKTGDSRKMNIYRYVGQGNAAAMHTMDMCMEEYIEYLMKHPHIAVYEDGVLRYEVERISGGDYTNGATVQLSYQARDYTVSMDNVGGVIVCMSY